MVANEVVAELLRPGRQSGQRLPSSSPIPHGRRELGGVLTQAAILAGLSDGRESNPVKRGAWLARQDHRRAAGRSAAQRAGAQGRDEEALAARAARTAPQSAGLRQVPLEDRPLGRAVRRVRRRRAAQAEQRWMPGRRFPTRPRSPTSTDLKRYLADDRIDQVAFSVLKHLAIYATGRSLTYNELEFLRKRRVKIESRRLPHAGHDSVRRQQPMFLEK